MLSHALALNRQTTRTDTAAILDFCRGKSVDDGPAGTFGYCLGGRKVFLAAQEFPQRFRATASLHGTRMVTDATELAASSGATHARRGLLRIWRA